MVAGGISVILIGAEASDLDSQDICWEMRGCVSAFRIDSKEGEMVFSLEPRNHEVLPSYTPAVLSLPGSGLKIQHTCVSMNMNST